MDFNMIINKSIDIRQITENKSGDDKCLLPRPNIDKLRSSTNQKCHADRIVFFIMSKKGKISCLLYFGILQTLAVSTKFYLEATNC